MSQSEMSQSDGVDDPAEIIQRQIKISTPRCWRTNDITALIQMWHELSGDPTQRPSDNPDFIEALIKHGRVGEPAKKEKEKEKKDSIFTEEEKALINDLHKLARMHLMRYFTLESPDALIAEVFGKNYKKRFPFKHAELRKRMLNGVYQIKHNTIENALKHVEIAVDRHGGRAIKTSRDTETVREFFSDLYNTENLQDVFYWIGRIIDLNKYPKGVRTFFQNVYVNLCTFAKFHIDDKHSADWDRTALVLFWDRLGKSERWKNVKIEHFILREPKVKNRKAKHGYEQNYAPIDADKRFGFVGADISSVEEARVDSERGIDGEDLVLDTPIAARTSNARNSTVGTPAARTPAGRTPNARNLTVGTPAGTPTARTSNVRKGTSTARKSTVGTSNLRTSFSPELPTIRRGGGSRASGRGFRALQPGSASHGGSASSNKRRRGNEDEEMDEMDEMDEMEGTQY